MTAAQVSGPPWPKKTRKSGTPNSVAVPACARNRGIRLGCRSSGGLRYIFRLTHLLRISGALLIIVATTCGKWWFIFETAAPHHSASITSLKPMNMST